MNQSAGSGMVSDKNDKTRASGVVEAVFNNVRQQKINALKGDIRVVGGHAMIRCLPWKILVIFHSPEANSSMGVFVQSNVDSDSQTWSCNAKATIQLVAQRPNCLHKEMKIQHTFTHKENDWGFQQFISYEDLFNPQRGFILPNDLKGTIIIRAHIKADAPHGADWDSKRYTGFVGLKNQGATCYLNSLLQALYCTNKLRRAVFLMPTESDDGQTSVPLALQRVFYELQFSDRAVGTKKLTRSFGWGTLDSFMQHDAQELCRVLLDNLENKMKGTSVEDVISGLFCGKMMSYINCLNVCYSSKREENFYNIQLKVNGNRTIFEAFKEYIAKETLTRDNKYDAGAHGLQEAEKGVIFTRFPPVLYLQLMRFQYDFRTDTNIKLNDRFEFPYILKLDEYLAEPVPSTYILHAVLVHSGDNHGGHYVVYINPALKGSWYQFDDDVVSPCSAHDAIDMNFGGTQDPDMRSFTNAYMLVYIAESEKDNVLCPVYETDIPESLRERFMDEQRVEEVKRIQKEKVHLYAAIFLFMEEDFYSWQGLDLCSQENLPFRLLRLKKQISRTKLTEEVAGILHTKPELIRLWRFQPRRKNLSTNLLELSENQPLAGVKDLVMFYVQSFFPGPESIVPSSDKHLFFLKYFDTTNWLLLFCGSVELRRDEPLRNLESIMRQRAGLASDCPLIIYQDDVKSSISEVTQLDTQIYKLYKREIQGQLFYFQAVNTNWGSRLSFDVLEMNEMGKDALMEQENINESTIIVDGNMNGANSSCARNPSTIDPSVLYKMAVFPSALTSKLLLHNQSSMIDPSGHYMKQPSLFDYFNSFGYKLEILLVDKLRPNDAGILIHVSSLLTYWEFASLVALHLSTKEDRLQFFRSQQLFGSPAGATMTGSELGALDGNANTGSLNSGAPTDGANNTGSGNNSRHTMVAMASGFISCIPDMNNMVSSAARIGLSKEPPGAAISSRHTGSMQEFFIRPNVWNTDSNFGPGMVKSGAVLGGVRGSTAQASDRLRYLLNRYIGMPLISRTPFGQISSHPPRRVYYAHLAIKIDELETMRQVHVVYVGPKLSENAELILSVPQNGTVSDLLTEARHHLVLPPGGSGQLRLLSVSRSRIIQEYPPTHKLSAICETIVFPRNYTGSIPVQSLRIEEIPIEELNIKSNEEVQNGDDAILNVRECDITLLVNSVGNINFNSYNNNEINDQIDDDDGGSDSSSFTEIGDSDLDDRIDNENSYVIETYTI